MKCSNCSSTMLITDEAATSRSQVTFYQCSLCISGHVSSEPKASTGTYQLAQKANVGSDVSKYFLTA